MNAAARKNPVFWLMWILPGAAVLASFATLAIALQGADRALPDIYHWEGDRLDADFERARVAARHQVSATLEMAGEQCSVSLENAPSDPAALDLRLTNGSDAALDQAVKLTRVDTGRYLAPCVAVGGGRWRVALNDEANTWALRANLDGPVARVELRARAPEGPGA